MAAELTQKDEKIAELLAGAGLKRNIAKVLVFLHKAGEAESMHIERAVNLRQPEVSMAMKELKYWGWVNEREVKRKGKGRPVKSYKLAKDLRDIVRGIVTMKKEELKETEKELSELKNIIG